MEYIGYLLQTAYREYQSVARFTGKLMMFIALDNVQISSQHTGWRNLYK